MAHPDRHPSPPLNISSQRPGETATEYANRLLAHLKEERHKRLQADLEAQRAIEGQRHLARSNKLLQEELQQQRNQTSPQTLPAYLGQVSRLQTHAVRLLPYQPPGSIPPHVQRDSASGSGAASPSSSPQPTTSGRTNIANKYYPLRLRPWSDFREEVQQKGFARIYGALQQSTHHGLPSRDWVQKDETTLLEDLPLLALNQEGGLNAARTHDFLKTVLLTPASRILNEYLNHSLGAADQKIFFDTAVQSIATALPSISGAEHVRPGNPDDVETAETADNFGNVADSPSETQHASKKKLPKKVLPDCLVYHIDSATTTADPVQLIASAEHKPLHAVRATSVSKLMNGPLVEDLVVRLARQALARREKKQRQSAERGQAPASAPQAEPGQRLPSDATSKTPKMDKVAYFAYALAQAYHYMFTAGLEFGFLATGEVLVFLRIPEEDATTLLYHVSLFPVPGATAEGNGSSDDGAQRFQAVTQAPYPAPSDPVGAEALAELPIAQMASFCEHAMHAERRPPAWIVEQAIKLAQFPELPPAVAARYSQRPSSQLGRRRYDDDDGGGDDDNSGDDGHGGHGPSRQLQIPHQGSRVRRASPLQQHMASRSSPEPADSDVDISATFLSTPCDLQARPRPSYKVKRPVLPYCTHACLLGLVQNGPLDAQCPNSPLHQAAGGQDREKSSQHPLTSLQLAQRIRDQLFDTPEVDCECALSHCGAIGFPFKLTLTGFGYTFVGKAVREEHRQRLVRESGVYKALLPLQGSVLPVHLGLIRLHVGYPVPSRFLQLPYMMLLSYAGASMAASLQTEAGEKQDMSPEVARDRAEAARTERELKSWGLDDEDNNASNVRWCAETGRAMRIDFERAQLVPTQDSDHALRISTTSHALHASQTHSAQTASSRNTPTTPRWDEEAEFPGFTGKPREEPLAKRRKVDDNDAVWQPVR